LLKFLVYVLFIRTVFGSFRVTWHIFYGNGKFYVLQSDLVIVKNSMRSLHDVFVSGVIGVAAKNDLINGGLIKVGYLVVHLFSAFGLILFGSYWFFGLICYFDSSPLLFLF